MTRFNSGGRESSRSSGAVPLFDPSKPDADLFDSLAEKQAESLSDINSAQLRRFFGEVKDLYRRFEAHTATLDQAERDQFYKTSIEPLFKMVRSKVAYASRAGGQSKITPDFADMLTAGIGKVNDAAQFRRFVMHFEAVVGFLYGKGKVNK